MIPTLLVTPLSFESSDYWFHALGRRIWRCAHNSAYTIAVSRSPENRSFYVSSTDKSTVVAACAALAADVRGSRAACIVLAFPNFISVIDSSGNHLSKDAAPPTFTGPITSSVEYIPLKWSPTFTYILKARYEMKDFYAQTKTLWKSVEESNSMREHLAVSMIENEDLKKAQSRLDRQVEQLKKMLRESNKERDAVTAHSYQLKCSLSLLNTQIVHLSRDFAQLRKDCITAFLQHGKSAQNVETVQLCQLLKTAIQCNHYFTNDRYTSAHFRGHIVTKAGVEGIPLEIISSFPRLRQIIDEQDMMSTLRAACCLLERPVDKQNVVWMG